MSAVSNTLLNFKTQIKGASNIKESWIEILDWSFGSFRHIPRNNAKVDNVGEVSDILLNKRVDVASPALFWQSVVGGHLGEAQLLMLTNVSQDKKAEPYLKLVLSEAILCNYSIGKTNDNLMESFQLSYSKITFEYTNYIDAKVDSCVSYTYNRPGVS